MEIMKKKMRLYSITLLLVCVGCILPRASAQTATIVDNGSSLSVNFNESGATLAIVHFTVTSGSSSSGQLNDTMSGSSGTFTYTIQPPEVPLVVSGAPLTVAYSVTYQVNGVQNTVSFPNWTRSSSGSTQTVATPTITPGAGSYSSPQTVTLSDATSGAAIYYTTDGTQPTTGSTLYSGAFTLSASATINAIAVESGYTNSSVASAAISITAAEQQAAPPVISPGTGTFTSTQTVTLSDGTPGAAIYYTTNGTQPTTSSQLYSGAFSVSSTTTVNAIAIANGYLNSSVSTATLTVSSLTNYSYNVVEEGSSSLVIYLDLTWVMPKNILSAPIITYSVTNSSGTVLQPQTSPTLSPVSGSTENWASAPITGLQTGDVVTFFFTYTQANGTNINAPINAPGTQFSHSFCGSSTTGSCTPTIALPTFTPAGGTYASGQSVTINSQSSWPSGTEIYYTTDGATPIVGNKDTVLYAGTPISVASSMSISAKAINGSQQSPAAVSTYIISCSGCAVQAPVFSAPSGTYQNELYLWLVSPTPGAIVYYTLDGTTPTTSSPRFSAGIGIPLPVGTTTVNAVAYLNGTMSSVASGTYVLQSLNQSTWNGMTTFTVQNNSKGEYANDQIYWMIIGQDPNSPGTYIHVNAQGQLVDMQESDNTISEPDGLMYANYGLRLDQVSSVTVPAILSARIYFSINNPVLIQYQGTGYAGPNFNNQSDPNLQTVFDFAEFDINSPTSGNPGIWINNGQVDMFGLPLELNVQGLDNFNATVGFPINEGTASTRQEIFAQYIASVPVEFQGLAQSPYAPLRIIAPGHGAFNPGKDTTGAVDGLPA